MRLKRKYTNHNNLTLSMKQVSENSITCSDCKGPAHEFGASIYVGRYAEDYTYCDEFLRCKSGYQRSFLGMMTLDNIEMRYFGKNGQNYGIDIVDLADKGQNVTIRNIAMNRGYYGALDIRGSDRVKMQGSVIYRAHLPVIRILSGVGNLISGNLAIVGIFSPTHRDAFLGDHAQDLKLTPMIGMFHDQAKDSKITNNIAAGSERAGFSGPGRACGDDQSFAGNLAHSALNGFWWDFYSFYIDRGKKAKNAPCIQLNDFTAFKIWEYGVYGEPQQQHTLEVVRVKLADCRSGILIVSGGHSAIMHVVKEKTVRIKDSLVVGHSSNGHCLLTKPGLYTCKHYMAWCMHSLPHHTGVFFGSFPETRNDGPKIHPWWETAPYPSLYGLTEISGVTFANFGVACTVGPRKGTRDRALSAMPSQANVADANAPLRLWNITAVAVEEDSLMYFPSTSPSWINGADCIDMVRTGTREKSGTKKDRT